MKREDVEQWDRDTMQMIKYPQRGDHFTEHLGSQLLVVRAFPGWVAVRRPDHVRKVWGPIRLMSILGFRKMTTHNGKPFMEGWRKGFCPRCVEREIYEEA